ncbi:MAG: hypothetical protein SOH81_05945 [Acetobacter sp.]|jgi:hypothetical protein
MKNHTPEPFTRKPSSHGYSSEELQEAQALSLGCVPAGPNAEAFVSAVAERIRPLIARKTTTAKQTPSRDRDKGKQKRVTETGIILAGLMRRGLRGKWQSVNEGHSGWFWQKERKLPFGHAAFWTKVNALKELGFVDYVPGKSWLTVWGVWQGEEARLRPSEALLSLAESFGCTKDTAASDWFLQMPSPVPPEPVPVLIGPFSDGGTSPTQPVPDSLHSYMARLSKAIAEHSFAGCAAPVLQMRFIGNLTLHGRIYAKGADNYQTMRKEYRRLITIDGEAVTEVDISASFLSIALIRSGCDLPDTDPYALPGLDMEKHRQAVKHWFVITFGAGKPCSKWPPKTDQNIRNSITASEIKRAALAHYPFLGQLHAVVLEDVMASVPDSDRSKAVGQYLTCLEAQIMRRAIEYVIKDGGIALPLHDALLVPVSWSEKARKAIERASTERLGRALRVTVG